MGDGLAVCGVGARGRAPMGESSDTAERSQRLCPNLRCDAIGGGQLNQLIDEHALDRTEQGRITVRGPAPHVIYHRIRHLTQAQSFGLTRREGDETRGPLHLQEIVQDQRGEAAGGGNLVERVSRATCWRRTISATRTEGVAARRVSAPGSPAPPGSAPRSAG
jgi:hypothetical protein